MIDHPANYQMRVDMWVNACLGALAAANRKERCHRFLEEAVELVQAGGTTKEDAHKLVDYVYGREVGQVDQEVGGVSTTLNALCNAFGINTLDAAERELQRCWHNIDRIRAKAASKRTNDSLPGVGA